MTRALRLPQAAYRDQLAPSRRSSPISTASSSTPAASAMPSAELLPRDAIPVVIVAGSASPVRRGGRIHVGKAWLIGQILTLAGTGRLQVAPDCPGGADLRRELHAFAAMPTRRGVRLQARGGARRSRAGARPRGSGGPASR